MKKTEAYILDGFNTDIVPLIMNRYAMSDIEALRAFVQSETYQLLLNEELGLWHFSSLAVFDIWENEHITGDLTNSLYIRGDEL